MSGPVDPALRSVLQSLERDGVAVADPRGLPFHHRFDILVKYLYVRERLGTRPAWAHVDVEQMYRRHVQLRTGGREPGDERRKPNLGAYQREFDALIDEMEASGFDIGQPVPVSRHNHLPYNGAHRLAAALALDCDVAWVWHEAPGGEWGEPWFREHGFVTEEINQLLHAWAELVPDRIAVALLWSPVEEAWPDLQAQLAAAGCETVAARTVSLPPEAFDEFVRDVYAFDWGPRVGEAIEAKVQLLRSFAPRVRVLFLQQPDDADCDTLRSLKAAVRVDVAARVPVEWYATLHLSETTAEARHLFDMLASSNNLRRLCQRSALRPGLVDMLVEMHREIRHRGIAPGDCAIVGGAVLDVLGLRSADDVDFTLRPAIRQHHFDAGIRVLSAHCDVVTANYARSFAASGVAPDDERLLADPSLHFMVRGLRVADPRVVLTRKQHQRRDKDLRDLPLLAGFLDRD